MNTNTVTTVAAKSEPMGFVAACKDYFGFKPDQGLKQFAEEVKQLTPADRAEMIPCFEALGYTIKQ